MVQARGERRRVAVVYHFFAHYRAAIMQTLLASETIDYLLVSDLDEPNNEIEAWQPPKDRWRWSPCLKLGANLIWQKGLLRLATQPRTDVIIFLGNANYLSTWCSAALARLLGKRVLFWTHGWVRDERGLKRLVRNSFYRLAHGLLLYGNRARAIGLRNGFSQENLYVIYNSLNYPQQRKLRETIGRSRLTSIRSRFFNDPASPVMICTGRLNKLKRIDLLLEAMSLLRDEGRDITNRSCDHLEAFARERNFPCIGVLLELENDGFYRALRKPVWWNPRFYYAGRSERGLEVRVYYFAGARLKSAEQVRQIRLPAHP